MRNNQCMQALCDQIRQTTFDLFRKSFCAFCGLSSLLTMSHPVLKEAEHHVRRQKP